MSVRIVVDSACDLGKEKASELGIEFISLKTIFGEKEYLDGDELSGKEFYEKLIESDELPILKERYLWSTVKMLL